MLSRIVMVLAGLCFSTGLAYAQGNTNSSNPYLSKMQQTLDKANAKAVSDFNKQYPQPTPSNVDAKQPTQPSVTPKTSTPSTSSQNPPSTATNQQTPDIAVTEQKKGEKKDGAVNIFASPGTTNSNNGETKSQNQDTPNIFR
jgi:hypothetical protein